MQTTKTLDSVSERESNAARSMAEKGYFVFHDVFSAEEISSLREAVRQHFRTTGRPDPLGGLRQANIAFEIPAIAWLFGHSKFLSCVRDAFDTDQIMFTSDATAYKDVLIGWHKDSPGYFDESPFNNDQCVIYKVGIYLYDHDKDGCGLWVREGSHRFEEQDVGPIRDTATRAGSIVVFDVRLSHRGLAKTLFLRGMLRLLSYVPRRLRPYAELSVGKARMLCRRIVGRERIALTVSFGLPNEYTFEFARRCMRRQVADTPGTSPFLPPKLRKDLEAEGVLLAEDHYSDMYVRRSE